MEASKNLDIRNAMKRAGVTMDDTAAALGITTAALYQRLQHDLSLEKTIAMYEAISEAVIAKDALKSAEIFFKVKDANGLFHRMPSLAEAKVFQRDNGGDIYVCSEKCGRSVF